MTDKRKNHHAKVEAAELPEVNDQWQGARRITDALDYEHDRREERRRFALVAKILTPREKQVFDLAFRHFSGVEIAEKLGMSHQRICVILGDMKKKGSSCISMGLAWRHKSV